jgi:hypothetical protein
LRWCPFSQACSSVEKLQYFALAIHFGDGDWAGHDFGLHVAFSSVGFFIGSHSWFYGIWLDY